MAEMGRYCKAYLVKDLREYPAWEENLANLRVETEYLDGEEIEVKRDKLDDEDVLYLQENYVVTDGIMKDEWIIFEKVTDDWKEFCHKQLEFSIPEWEPIEIKVEESD